jgi:hypothetical protein
LISQRVADVPVIGASASIYSIFPLSSVLLLRFTINMSARLAFSHVARALANARPTSTIGARRTTRFVRGYATENDNTVSFLVPCLCISQ